jgi:hypothetical protein
MMYSPMSKLKNKPQTKPLGPLFEEIWSITTRNTGFYAIFGYFGAI